MKEPETKAAAAVPHHGLFEATVGVVGRGTGSKVFNLDEIPELASEHDRRRKKILLNSTNTGSELLVDVVSYAPGGTSPLHFHREIDHFFFVLEGSGRIVINEQEHRLRAGSPQPGRQQQAEEGDERPRKKSRLIAVQLP